MSIRFLDNERARSWCGDNGFATKPGEIGRSPSITNGVTATTFTGDPEIDLANLIRDYVAAGGRMESATVAISSQSAIALRLTGNEAFAELDRQT